jgi:hypothetical protein
VAALRGAKAGTLEAARLGAATALEAVPVGLGAALVEAAPVGAGAAAGAAVPLGFAVFVPCAWALGVAPTQNPRTAVVASKMVGFMVRQGLADFVLIQQPWNTESFRSGTDWTQSNTVGGPPA